MGVKDDYDESETFGPMRSPEFDFKKHYIPLMENYKAALWKLDELEAENQKLREALTRIDDASNHYAMTPTYSEGTLRYAHKSTRNLARAALLEDE